MTVTAENAVAAERAPAPAAMAPVQPAPAQAEPAPLADPGEDPAAEDGSSEVTQEFVSRRQELGQPRSVVPDAAAELAERPVSSTRGSGAWYKLGAGLVFLLSLGYIGYRHKQTRRVADTDWRAYEQPLSEWLPPSEVAPARGAVTSSSAPGSRRRPGDESDAMGNDLLVREAGRRSRAASSFDVYDEVAPSDPGFHPEIEKRVRRKQMDAMSELGNGYGPSQLARGAGYAAIGELKARGYKADEIARHLGLTTAEVRTYLQIEQRPMLD